MPRVPIGRWPTPIKRLDAVGERLGREVWVKSEESCGAWGGNKIRKLEYIFAEVERRGAQRIVTYGAGTSSWTAAVALHGHGRGYDVVVGLGGDVPAENRLLYAHTGTRIYVSRSYNLTPVAAARAVVAAGFRDTIRLPAGGSGLTGDVGSMGAGLEIAEAIESEEMPAVAAVYVPAGTAGTAAGLAVGLGIGGASIPVVAVRVTPRPLGTARLVRRHARKLMAFLSNRGVATRGREPALVLGEDRFFPPAYGRGNSSSREAIEIAREDSLELDPTYAAKAFAALVADSRAGQTGPVLFLHTSPGPLSYSPPPPSPG